ncbi:hypothetical protein HDU76_008372 [Blyttiomyces sp. JEL0837]|nr:hypothetical protein HDU76_008372 [Blyttiomyces sp. JEL0837]
MLMDMDNPISKTVDEMDESSSFSTAVDRDRDFMLEDQLTTTVPHHQHQHRSNHSNNSPLAPPATTTFHPRTRNRSRSRSRSVNPSALQPHLTPSPLSPNATHPPNLSVLFIPEPSIVFTNSIASKFWTRFNQKSSTQLEYILTALSRDHPVFKPYNPPTHKACVIEAFGFGDLDEIDAVLFDKAVGDLEVKVWNERTRSIGLTGGHQQEDLTMGDLIDFAINIKYILPSPPWIEFWSSFWGPYEHEVSITDFLECANRHLSAQSPISILSDDMVFSTSQINWMQKASNGLGFINAVGIRDNWYQYVADCDVKSVVEPATGNDGNDAGTTELCNFVKHLHRLSLARIDPVRQSPGGQGQGQSQITPTEQGSSTNNMSKSRSRDRRLNRPKSFISGQSVLQYASLPRLSTNGINIGTPSIKSASASASHGFMFRRSPSPTPDPSSVAAAAALASPLPQLVPNATLMPMTSSSLLPLTPSQHQHTRSPSVHSSTNVGGVNNGFAQPHVLLMPHQSNTSHPFLVSPPIPDFIESPSSPVPLFNYATSPSVEPMLESQNHDSSPTTRVLSIRQVLKDHFVITIISCLLFMAGVIMVVVGSVKGIVWVYAVGAVLILPVVVLGGFCGLVGLGVLEVVEEVQLKNVGGRLSSRVNSRGGS